MKNLVKIISIILIVLLLVGGIFIIKKNSLIKKVAAFSINKYEKCVLTENRYNSNNELYNFLRIYKYGEKWHYVINDKDVYFNETDTNMTIIEDGTKSVQEKFDMNAGPQTYSEYLNWDSKNIFEKISYSFNVSIKEDSYEGKNVVIVTDKNCTWYLDSEEYFPVVLENDMGKCIFEFSQVVAGSDVNFEEE